MTLLALPGRASGARAASACRRFGSVKPLSRLRPPAFSVSRRVKPSQQRRGVPSMVIMNRAPLRVENFVQFSPHLRVSDGLDGEQPLFEPVGQARDGRMEFIPFYRP